MRIELVEPPAKLSVATDLPGDAGAKHCAEQECPEGSTVVNRLEALCQKAIHVQWNPASIELELMLALASKRRKQLLLLS